MTIDSPTSVAQSDQALVVFTPSGKRGHFPVGTPLLTAARQLGVDVDSVCGGRGICGRCKVNIGDGEFSKHGITSRAEHITRLSDTEARFEARKGSLDGRRLSCSTKVVGDVVVNVPPESQVHKQVVRKLAEVHDIALNANVSLHLVEVEEPDMHEGSSDSTRLQRALAAEWALPDLTIDPSLLLTLQQTLRKGDWQVTAAVRDSREIVAVWPGLKERVLGISVDIGSTTIAASLVDMQSGEVLTSSGIMNPQIRFGEDVMSRVSYVMMNDGGEVELTDAVRQGLNDLFAALHSTADTDANDVTDISVVCNPVMHHLLLGINPVELGTAPFALTVEQGLTLPASALSLTANPGARVYVLPCIAGHVGADTAGVVLAEAPYDQAAMTLLVDVGTNAEIVLGNRDKLWACSSPTGPAFEGAQISGGQRAAPGAIERVRIDRETLQPRYQVIGSALWSDDEAFSDAIQSFGVTGICGSGIIEVVAEMFLAGIIDEDGVIRASAAERSARVVADGRTFSYILHPGNAADGSPEVRITQNDVRAIQLAKAALYAGIKLLMDKAGIARVERIRLAGAFGSHIDVKYAMVLGLIPDCDLAAVSSAGNAAGTGARIALLDKDSRQTIEQAVRQIEKIETAVEAKFQDYFVEAMALPNKKDTFPELAKVITLPNKSPGNPDSNNTPTDRPRRRRRSERQQRG